MSSIDSLLANHITLHSSHYRSGAFSRFPLFKLYHLSFRLRCIILFRRKHPDSLISPNIDTILERSGQVYSDYWARHYVRSGVFRGVSSISSFRRFYSHSSAGLFAVQHSGKLDTRYTSRRLHTIGYSRTPLNPYTTYPIALRTP